MTRSTRPQWPRPRSWRARTPGRRPRSLRGPGPIRGRRQSHPRARPAARSWTEPEWHSATTSLHHRGLLDDSGALTPDGHALHAWVEHRTDQASRQPRTTL
ncbi:helix-turn-helix domain-containing protein [Nocardia miyunensis]|uniref:helix-turn-helix domain-containing protein n=1 Tax=Nocardia miyunensis TaxID=282684 RepID=UPI003F764A9F